MRSKTSNDKARKKLFSPGETRLLEAVAERIFPATGTPGAVEIGAVEYVLRALAGDYAQFLRLYRSGLRAVERQARKKFRAPFASLRDERKDAVLADFEAGRVSGFKPAADFFETLRCHVLEGVFGEPEYGGNRNLAGWRLVGFPGQRQGYADAYIDKPVDLPPVATHSPEKR